MKTITHTGGLTSNYLTVLYREVPLLKDFPAHSGAVKSVQLQTSVRVGVDTSYTYTIYLFKTFSGDSGYWEERDDHMYQYPNDSDHHLTVDMIGDVLASVTITESLVSGGNLSISKTLTPTEYGKRCENWAGDVYLAIISDRPNDTYWCTQTTSTLALECGSGTVRYCTGGEKVLCEVYYGGGGSFKQVEMQKGVDGVFVEIGD